MPLLIVTAVEREARAIGSLSSAHIIVAGVGRTNAASATTEALLRAQQAHQPFDAVISAGVAGALPAIAPDATALDVGQVIVASSCVYAEEGLIAPDGFADMTALGFPLGDWPGNAVPVDPDLLQRLDFAFMTAPVATVATCSGTDAAATAMARRTGALAEAMEGAAVVHAARRLDTPAIELRTISNTTGDRARQRWDLSGALDALHGAVITAVKLLQLDDSHQV